MMVKVLVCIVRHALLRLNAGDQGIVLVFVQCVCIKRRVESVVHFLNLIRQFQAGVSIICRLKTSPLHRRDDI